MRIVNRLLLLAAATVALAACVNTEEMPLAPNVVRLDTQASGALFVGQAPKATLRRAAELTLQNGYTHFRFEQATMGQGSELSGVYSSGSASAFGNASSASVYGSGFSTPIYRHTENVGVTVVMFHANEPGAKGAFVASQVLQQYGNQ